MKSKSKIILVALVFGAYCCSPKGDGSVSIVDVGGSKMAVFNLNELKTDVATIALSNFVENWSMVQLESVEEAYVGRGVTMVTEKYIGIRQSREPYKLFDRSGKFLRNIGGIGNGPGEWTINLYDEIIDDENELIYLAPFMRDRILVYSTSGQLVKELVAPHQLSKPKIFLSDGILTVVHMPFQDDRVFAFQFDVNTGEILRELGPPPAHLIVQNFDSELFSSRNAQGIFDIIHTSSDTLYHFDVKNNKLLPAFTVDFFTSERAWKRYYQLNKNMFLTDVRIYDENTRRFEDGDIIATDMTSLTSSRIKVVNDFLGNMSFGSIGGNSHNGYFVVNFQPEDLMEDIEKRLAESGVSTSDREALTKTLSTLKEGANNVVFIGKLKSEVKTKLW